MHKYSDNCTCSSCHKVWMEALFGATTKPKKKKQGGRRK